MTQKYNVYDDLRRIRAAISRIERRQPKARRDKLEHRADALDAMDCDAVILAASRIKRRGES